MQTKKGLYATNRLNKDKNYDITKVTFDRKLASHFNLMTSFTTTSGKNEVRLRCDSVRRILIKFYEKRRPSYVGRLLLSENNFL